VNKKKQKNFESLKHLALILANPAEIRSFLLLFFKKEALSCVSKKSLSDSPYVKRPIVRRNMVS
jgi:hypothetical protein